VRPAELAIDATIFCLIAASSWMLVTKRKNLHETFWRWILAAVGLLLVSGSFALYMSVLTRLLRSPEVQLNVDSLLALTQSYTRFYPTSLGLLGAALGLFGRGSSRWTILSAGILVGFRWYLFTVSLL
jgi:hypothetical protein